MRLYKPLRSVASSVAEVLKMQGWNMMDQIARLIKRQDRAKSGRALHFPSFLVNTCLELKHPVCAVASYRHSETLQSLIAVTNHICRRSTTNGTLPSSLLLCVPIGTFRAAAAVIVWNELYPFERTFRSPPERIMNWRNSHLNEIQSNLNPTVALTKTITITLSLHNPVRTKGPSCRNNRPIFIAGQHTDARYWYKISVRLSVPLSVRLSGIVYERLYIISTFFTIH